MVLINGQWIPIPVSRPVLCSSACPMCRWNSRVVSGWSTMNSSGGDPAFVPGRVLFSLPVWALIKNSPSVIRTISTKHQSVYSTMVPIRTKYCCVTICSIKLRLRARLMVGSGPGWGSLLFFYKRLQITVSSKKTTVKTTLCFLYTIPYCEFYFLTSCFFLKIKSTFISGWQNNNGYFKMIIGWLFL